MPTMPQELVDCAVFLYPSEADALAGEKWGGSGFLVGVPLTEYRVHLYVVSNHHVANVAPVARLMQGGEANYVDGAGHWQAHDEGDDVAVLYLGLAADRTFDYINRHSLLASDDLQRRAIGPGDDCLMAGRYIRPNGQQIDRPVVRFGNIAMSPPERIYQEPRAYWQESFLVDMRSQSGFSGAPVVVYYGNVVMTGPPGDRGQVDISHPDTTTRHALGDWWLLGIDWGNLPIPLDVRSREPLSGGTEGTTVIGRAEVGTGMACVVPAWKLTDLIDSEDAMEQRKRAEAASERSEGDAVLDVATPPSEETVGIADLLGRLIRIPKSDGTDG